MFKQLKAPFLCAVIVCGLSAIPASAQIGIIWDVAPPGPGNTAWFLGAANMDNDAGEELVYFDSSPDQILIIDGQTGNIDWNSGEWNTIYIAGYNYYTGTVGGRNWGFSPFCDHDGDGKKEITFMASQNQGDPFTIHLVGFGGTGINSNNTPNLPETHNLSQNFPNPFNPNTTISYQLTSPGRVNITIYNVLGQAVKTIVDEDKPQGEYSIVWDGKNNAGKNLASGTYFYQLRVGDYTSTKKSLLLK